MTVFRIATVAAVLALVTLMLHAGQPSEPGWWADTAPLGLWVIGPAAAPYVLAARRRGLSTALSAYFAVSTMVSGLAYYDAFARPRSSTAALALVLVPIYQWLVLALLLLICWGVARLGRRDKVA